MKTEFDYIIIGSGAGGGTVAANLAEAGHSVLLLEAGNADQTYNYEIPAFHAAATEDPRQRWDFYVRHYQDDKQQALNKNFQKRHGGVLYPRAATLGGCTAHNAMITVCPHARDWDDIARLTGDKSWRNTAMNKYFEKLERCMYVQEPWRNKVTKKRLKWLRLFPFLYKRLANVTGHGFDGWLSTNLTSPFLALGESQLIKILAGAAESTLQHALERPLTALEGLNTFLDPNDIRARHKNAQGVWLVPMATRDGRRNGTRERLLEVATQHPEHLTILTNALATKVILNEQKTAVAVEYILKPHAYGADPLNNGEALPPHKTASVKKEVIISGGAFNSPQLLMLSGIGSPTELRKHGITVKVELPGVGQGLQDRYEVGVVSRMDREFSLLRGKRFAEPIHEDIHDDKGFQDWLAGRGVYTSNGVVVGITKKSHQGRPEPDLFIFGVPSTFTGYYPGYSSRIRQDLDTFTWAILKGHTNNTAGYVTLKTADPSKPPVINFRYFHEGNDTTEEDLDAVVVGIKFARKIMANASSVVQEELVPGSDVCSDDELRTYVRNQAWGHHASCTCRMGKAEDPLAVVDSKFNVIGTRGLRVVDASVFPSIPGLFIATAIYMAAEKASNDILHAANRFEKLSRSGQQTAYRRLGKKLTSKKGQSR